MLSKIGQIDHVSVYLDITQNPNEYIIGRKGSDNLPSGMVYLPYDNDITQPITNNIYVSDTDNYNKINFILGSSEDLDFYRKIIHGLKPLDMKRDDKIDKLLW